jgi:hypothetical protein
VRRGALSEVVAVSLTPDFGQRGRLPRV